MRISAFNEGHTDALVILSGYMFGGWTFEPMIKQMHNMPVLIVDNIGSRDDGYAGPACDLVVDEIAAELTKRGIGSFHLAGHSMGGFLAQEFARRHPDRLNSLILLGCCHVNEFRNSHRTKARPVLDTLFNLDEESFFRLTTHGIFTTDFLNDPALLAGMREHFNSDPPDRESCRSQLDVLDALFQLAPDRPHLNLPCLAVYGSDDTIVPADWVQRLSDHFDPSPQFEALQSGHMFMYEQPEESAAILRQWLEKPAVQTKRSFLK